MQSWATLTKMTMTALQQYISNSRNFAKVFMKPHKVTIFDPAGTFTEFGFKSNFVGLGVWHPSSGLPMEGVCSIAHTASLSYLTHVSYAFNTCKFENINSVNELLTSIPTRTNRVSVSAEGMWTNTDIPFWILFFPNKFKKSLFGDYYIYDNHPYGAIVCEDIYGAPNLSTARMITFAQACAIFDCRPIAKYTSEIRALPDYVDEQESEPILPEKTVVRVAARDKYADIFSTTEKSTSALLLDYLDTIKSKSYDSKCLAFGFAKLFGKSSSTVEIKDSIVFLAPYNFAIDFKPDKNTYGYVYIMPMLYTEKAFDPSLVVTRLPITSLDDIRSMVYSLSFRDTLSYWDSKNTFYGSSLLMTAHKLSCFLDLSTLPVESISNISTIVKSANMYRYDKQAEFNNVLNFISNYTQVALQNINKYLVNNGYYKLGSERFSTYEEFLTSVRKNTARIKLVDYKKLLRDSSVVCIDYKLSKLSEKYPFGVSLQLQYSYGSKGYLVVKMRIPDIFMPFADVYIGDELLDTSKTFINPVALYDKLVAEHNPVLNEPHPYLGYLSRYNMSYFASTIYDILFCIQKNYVNSTVYMADFNSPSYEKIFSMTLSYIKNKKKLVKGR